MKLIIGIIILVLTLLIFTRCDPPHQVIYEHTVTLEIKHSQYTDTLIRTYPSYFLKIYIDVTNEELRIYKDNIEGIDSYDVQKYKVISTQTKLLNHEK